MTNHRESSRRDFSGNQLGDNATIIQGDTHLHLPHRPARPSIRIIPYPRNEDFVSRPDLVARINEVLPRTTESCSAALWGLGGSGKTQLALDYGYRRCQDRDCSVFWVHADSKATFSQDYKRIARRLGVDKTLEDEALFVAVRESIESLPTWALILDNADDLTLFGVGTSRETNSLFDYIPKSPTGTTLWTSRDEHIIGTLVGSRRGVRVGRMTVGQATELLNMRRNIEQSDDVAGTAALLEELQWLPLAVSQAGAYVRRTSTPVNEYLSMLSKGKQRWGILNETELDRHRRPDAANSVLETWAISINQIRQESKTAYRILHVLGYVDNRNITSELLRAASVHTSKRAGDGLDDGELSRAITRLKQFSFISEEQTGDSKPSYEMHKLVHEAVRYGLKRRTPAWIEQKILRTSSKKTEAYFSGIAVQVIGELFPTPEPKAWPECEKYLGHAVQVGEWAELSGKKIETEKLLTHAASFLFDRCRWRESEPIVKTLLHLQQELFGTRHPVTISSMANLASTYRMQGRDDEAKPMQEKALDLRREVLGGKHAGTMESMASLGQIYSHQGRYTEAESLQVEALSLQRELFGEKHRYTMYSLTSLAVTYCRQGRYSKAEALLVQALDIYREVLGEKDHDTLTTMHNLAQVWYDLGRLHDAISLMEECVQWRSVADGPDHPQTKIYARKLAQLREASRKKGCAQ